MHLVDRAQLDSVVGGLSVEISTSEGVEVNLINLGPGSIEYKLTQGGKLIKNAAVEPTAEAGEPEADAET